MTTTTKWIIFMSNEHALMKQIMVFTLSIYQRQNTL